MNFKNLLLLSFASTIIGCAPSIHTQVSKTYPPLNSKDDIKVIELTEPLPSGAEEIGMVSIGDNFTIHCNYELVLGLAKEEARKAGGNAIKITKHSYPDIASSCHRITAKILKTSHSSDPVPAIPNENNLKQTDSTKVEQRDYSKSNPPVLKKSITILNDWNWRIALNGGWSWRTAKTPSGLSNFLQDYIDELKSGNTFGGDVSYFFSDYLGAGMKYNLYLSSNSISVTELVNGNYITGTLSDDISIYFIGPTFWMRFPSPTKANAFLMGMSLGYMGYKDYSAIPSDKATVRGSTFAVVYDFNYDLGLSQHTALGVGLSLALGTLSSYDVTKGSVTQNVKLDRDNYEGLSHVDITVGLRFR